MGRYVRHREYRQYTRFYTRWLKQACAKKRLKKMIPTGVPQLLEEKYGIKVVDPLSPDFPHPRPTMDIADSDEMPIESHPLYKNRKCHLHDGTMPLAEGVKHACTLVKALPNYSLPTSLMERVKELDLDVMQPKVHRLIMQSQAWDPTFVKLPKRRDPTLWWINWPRYYGTPLVRKNEVLLDNLFRHSLTLADQFPDLRNLRHFKKGQSNVVVERNDELLRFASSLHITVAAPTLLPPIADDSEVKKTAEQDILSIEPIGPFIDLVKENIYDDSSIYPLMWSGNNNELSLVPQTLMLNKDVNMNYPWTPTETAANAVLAAFGAAASFARLKYATPSDMHFQKVLPDPVTVQCVQVCGGSLDFVVFQLNTLSLNDDSGVKNLVWVDKNNTLFSSPDFFEQFTEVKDYDPETLRKVFALMLHGI